MLPNISEVPGSEVPDSSSFHSNESNESRPERVIPPPPLMNPQDSVINEMTPLNEEESSYAADEDEGENTDSMYNFNAGNFWEHARIASVESSLP
jgi:protocadherin Fat 1/2/3